MTKTMRALAGAVLALGLSATTAQASEPGDTIARIGNDPALTPAKTSPIGFAAANAALLDPRVPIIVLGARLNPDCTAPAVLDSRTDTALGLALAHPLNRVVVTGGATQPGCQTEADYMKARLVARGVDPARIVTDTSAYSTVGNAAGTAHTAGDAFGVTRAGVIVTSGAHAPRATNTFAATDSTALWLVVPAPVD